ncbi:MAG: 4-hydroxy-tetrahydrodipicolinate reductase [Pseudomonadota bacterium]
MEPMAMAVLGVAGRMGRMLAGVVRDHPEATLSGATVRPGHGWLGQDVGTALGGPKIGVAVEADAAAVTARASAILDFTSPAVTVAQAEIAAAAGTVHVIGTTGFSDDQQAAIARAAERTAIVQAGNMSLGVNLLTELTRKVAAALDASWDIEIVEMHHGGKVDAPSGTALMLGDAAATGRGGTLAEMAERGRDGLTGRRVAGRIGFASLRGGDVVGEHDVIFAGEGERIVLRHIATDRAIFARGAVRAALWARGKPPGLYTMRDVLGL